MNVLDGQYHKCINAGRKDSCLQDSPGKGKWKLPPGPPLDFAPCAFPLAGFNPYPFTVINHNHNSFSEF